MSIFADTPEKKLAALQKERVRLSTRIAAAKDALSILRGSRGAEEILEAFLNGNEAHQGTTRQRVNSYEAEIADFELARGALANRIKSTIVDCAKKRAMALEEKARGLREALAKHQVQTRKLLDQLHDHEGVWFALPVPEALPPNTIAASAVTFRAPKSHVMESEILAIESQAKRFVPSAEARLRRDFIDGHSLDELLEAAVDIEKLAPLEPSIRAWFAAASVRPPQTRATHNYSDQPAGPRGEVFFHLEWTGDGEIDTASSKAILGAPSAAKTLAVVKKIA